MSKEYDEYIKEHCANVRKGFYWIKRSLPEVLIDIPGVDYELNILLPSKLQEIIGAKIFLSVATDIVYRVRVGGRTLNCFPQKKKPNAYRKKLLRVLIKKKIQNRM